MGVGVLSAPVVVCERSVSPVGELLFLAWPRKSNQKEGHPCFVGLRLPCAARRPGRRGNSPLRAQTPRAFSPRPAALLGDSEGASFLTPARVQASELPARGSGFCSPSTLPIWRVRMGQERNRVRAPQQGAFCAPCQGELVKRPSAHAKSGTRRAAMWGRLSLVTFFGGAKKVTRPKAKSEAVAYTRCLPRTVQ
jgi:hypothetical protein